MNSNNSAFDQKAQGADSAPELDSLLREYGRSSSLNREPLTRSDLLSALDRQIKDIEDENKRPGWSIWALLGALGTIAWLIPSQFDGKTNLQVVGSAVLFVLLCGDAFFLVFVKIRPPWMPYRNQFRFRLARNQPGFTREFMLFLVCRNVGMLIIYNSLDASMQVPMFNIYFGLLTVGNGGLFLMTFRKEPAGQRTVISDRLSSVIDGLNLLSAVWAGVICFFILQRIHVAAGSLIPSDIRLGLLIGFSILLVQMIVTGEKERPIIDKLKAIARDLAFSRISTEEAASEADLQLSGMTGSAMLKKISEELTRSLQMIVVATEKLANDCLMIEPVLNRIEGQLEDGTTAWKEDARKVAAFLDRSTTEISTIKVAMAKAFSRAKKVGSLFETCKKETVLLSREARAEAGAGFDKGIETFKKVEAVSKQQERIKQQFIALTLEDADLVGPRLTQVIPSSIESSDSNKSIESD